DILAESHLDAPWQAFDPALLLELLRSRAERIGRRAEKVELAVTIEIDARAVELRRHELGEAHGARPGATHLVALQNPILEEAQGVDQFLAEEILPPSDVGLCRERADHVMTRAMAAECRLTAPDG